MPSLKFLHHTILFWLLACFLSLNVVRLYRASFSIPEPAAFHLEKKSAWLLEARKGPLP